MFRAGFKGLLVLGACLFLPQQSQASFWMACDVEALVLEEPKEDMLAIKVLGTVNQSNGSGDCSELQNGEPLAISIALGSVEIKAGDMVHLTYTEKSGMTPNGPFSKKTWYIKHEHDL